MKKRYPLFCLIGFSSIAMAQTPTKISKDTASAYRIAANGSTVIWFDRKNGDDHIYVSYNKQKATVSNYTAVNGVDALIAGTEIVGFVEDYKHHVSSDGITFLNPAADTTIASAFFGTEVHGNKVITFEPTINADFKIHERAGVTGSAMMITDKARIMSHNKGYISWWDQTAHTINFRMENGSVKSVSQVEDVKAMIVDQNKTAWIKDGTPGSLQMTTNGENQVKIDDVVSVNAQVYFLGDDKLVVYDNGVTKIYQHTPSAQLLKTYNGLVVTQHKNKGFVLINGTSVPYTLNNAGDTINLSTVPGYSQFSFFDVSGEQLCMTTRPSAFVSIIKWFKNGVYQKDLLPDSSSGAINDKGFYVSDNSVAWAQSSFNKPANTGIYLYEFTPTTTGLFKTTDRIPVSIYPNPVDHSFTLQAEDAKRVELYTIQGMLVRSADYNNGIVDVADLKTGIYFVKVYTSSDRTGVIKFIKQ